MARTRHPKVPSASAASTAGAAPNRKTIPQPTVHLFHLHIPYGTLTCQMKMFLNMEFS